MKAAALIPKKSIEKLKARYYCGDKLRGLLRTIRPALLIICCAFLLILSGILVVDKFSSPPPERQYTAPPGVKIVAGGGPLDCEFSKVEGPILTGILPRHERPSLNLQIPRGYLKNPITDGGQGADGTVLMFMKIDTFLPDRKPLPSEPSDNLDEVERQRNQLMMLVWDAATPSAILENLARSYQVDVRIAEGLSEGFVTMASNHGDKDLSVSISENEIRDVLLCDSQSSVKYPSCQHYFRFQGTDVQMNYRRRYLGDWKAIRERSEKFLQCIISK